MCGIINHFNVWQCDPADNTDAAGYNVFCNSKDPDGAGPMVASDAPYCDLSLKKCLPCSITNNNPSNVSGGANANDCPAGNARKGWVDNPADPNDHLVIGKCNLDTTPPGATKGGTCAYASTCFLNTECSSACCSKESSPGPTEPTGRCIIPASVNNPINPYLCKP